MKEYLEFDTAPTEEECVQTGITEDYLKMQAIEYSALKKQLLRTFGECEGVRITRLSNYHDFGTYYSMKMTYDIEEETAIDYVYNIEENFPDRWDEESLKELREAGYDISRKVVR